MLEETVNINANKNDLIDEGDTISQDITGYCL